MGETLRIFVFVTVVIAIIASIHDAYHPERVAKREKEARKEAERQRLREKYEQSRVDLGAVRDAAKKIDSGRKDEITPYEAKQVRRFMGD